MPDFKSLADFHAKLSKSVSVAEKIKITRLMGLAAQVVAAHAASADLGGDPKFSGWKPSLDTHLKTTVSGATVLLPTRTGAGPWTVAESGRNRGNGRGFSGPGVNVRTGRTSRTKVGGVRKVRAHGGKRWNGVTQPKHTASQALARMEVVLPKIAVIGTRKVLQKSFDVT